MHARPTRFSELGYRQDAPGLWRVVALDSPNGSTGASIGPQYRTKAELLGDLELYAAVYGCKENK
jgi:hypothetical protein